LKGNSPPHDLPAPPYYKGSFLKEKMLQNTDKGGSILLKKELITPQEYEELLTKHDNAMYQ